MAQRPSIRAGYRQRYALKGLGAILVTDIAILERLGFLRQLVRFDTGMHFQATAQNGFPVTAIMLIEFLEQAPQRSVVQTHVGRVS